MIEYLSASKIKGEYQMRSLLVTVLVLSCASPAFADSPGLPTQIVLATFRLEHPKTSGTAFVIRRPHPNGQEGGAQLLVTAAHAFEQMDGDQAKLVLRQQDSNGDWSASPVDIVIRQDGKPLWQKHPEQDVAVLRLDLKDSPELNPLSIDILATEDDWQASSPEPGAEIRCVGFPHACAVQAKCGRVSLDSTRLHRGLSTPAIEEASYVSGRLQHV